MRTKKLTKDQEKMCNICGDETLLYTIVDNAPLCNHCVPVPKQTRDKINAGEIAI